jgi:hypothetical protein
VKAKCEKIVSLKCKKPIYSKCKKPVSSLAEKPITKVIPKPKIAVLSDIHYYDSQLGSNGNAFMQYLVSDRKMLLESDSILNSAISSIKSTDSDIVLVTGDLTKDGELVNHIEVAKKLSDLEKAGKKVYVINGNHDINNPHAVKFEGNTITPVPNVSPEIFQQIYNEFGYDEAIAKDTQSLSYVVEPQKGLWIIAMDSCIYQDNMSQNNPTTDGKFSPDRLSWIKKQLEKAQKENITVIGMMHHGLVQHFTVQEEILGEYLIDDWRNLATQFADLGLSLVFTGHAHSQDSASITSTNGNMLTDVETGSLVTYPSPYRLAEFTGKNELKIKSQLVNSINYNTYGLPFQEYAKAFLADGYKTILPYMFKQIMLGKGFPSSFVEAKLEWLKASYPSGVTPLDVLVESMISNHYGDETPTTNLLYLASKINISDPAESYLLGIMNSLSQDTAPSDNSLTVNIK